MYLVCGEALFDVFAESSSGAAGNRLALDAVAGGSPFNVALGLCRLGAAAGLFTGLSRDYLGQQLRRVLDDEGVATAFLVELDAPTTLAMVALDDEGTPHYSFRGEGCADRLLGPEHLPTLDDRIRGIHLGSYSLVVQPTANTLLALVRRESGRRLISLDPNVRLNVEPDIQRWLTCLDELVDHADLIKVSEEDLALLYPNQDAERIAAGWLERGCRLVFLTRGGDGACVFNQRHGRLCVPARPVEVRDSVGAGDSFQAALLAWLAERGLDTRDALDDLSRDDLEALLAFAAEAAAVTCTRTGPDLPYRRELGMQN